jgi:hypothetical protein
MTIDHELITQVQQVVSEEFSHRARTLLACYVGFVGLLDQYHQYPALRDRALAIEEALRTFCTTGELPNLPAPSALMDLLRTGHSQAVPEKF